MEMKHGGPLTKEEYQRRARMEEMCILVRDDAPPVANSKGAPRRP
jgi:hypothetical protein